MNWKYVFNSDLKDWYPEAKRRARPEGNTIAENATAAGYALFCSAGQVFACFISGGVASFVKISNSIAHGYTIPPRLIYKANAGGLLSAAESCLGMKKKILHYGDTLYFVARPDATLFATLSTEPYYFENIIIRPLIAVDVNI